jgi:hypothetical protein
MKIMNSESTDFLWGFSGFPLRNSSKSKMTAWENERMESKKRE